MLLKEGSVLVDGKKAWWCSQNVEWDEVIELKGSELDGYVSRSALKLKYFLESHDEIQIQNKICLDIGASTGGFTQVLLSHGAKQVYALDVGHGQLDPNIQEDDRVIQMDGLDVRDFDTGIFLTQEWKFDVVTVDVSFISLTKILDDLIRIITECWSRKGVNVVLLWKPQFEVGRRNLTKKGVVKKESIRSNYLDEFLQILTTKGLHVVLHEKSGLSGEEGNVEEVIWIQEGSP